MSEGRQDTRVSEYAGWEIHRASPSSFSIRRGGQSFGPYDSVEAARSAIDAEEGRPPVEPTAQR